MRVRVRAWVKQGEGEGEGEGEELLVADLEGLDVGELLRVR